MLSGYVPFIGTPLGLPTVLLLMVVMLYLRPGGLFGTRGLGAGPLNAALPGATMGLAPRPKLALVPGTSAGRAARIGVGGASLALAIVPVFLLPYIEARLWTEVVATAIALWGLGLLMGPGGQLSLGHGAFLGLGAYATMIAATRYDLYPLAGLVPAAILGFVVGLAFGLPALRIRGQYLAMVTLSLAVAFPMVIQRFAWLTGGSSGPAPVEVTPPSWFDIAPDRPYAWLHLAAVLTAAVVVWLLMNLDRSVTGRAMRAAAENDQAAAAMGVPVVRTKALTFGVVAMLGAVAGGLVGLQNQAVTSDSFDVFRSLALYAAVVLGGAGTLVGGGISAVILVGVPWFNMKMGWGVSPNLLYGGLLVVATALFPDGVAPSLSRAVRRVVGWVDVTPKRPSADVAARGAGGETAERAPVISS
jgi:branched-chain amino acid transport system permease protein